jgi:hypothetical protein
MQAPRPGGREARTFCVLGGGRRLTLSSLLVPVLSSPTLGLPLGYALAGGRLCICVGVGVKACVVSAWLSNECGRQQSYQEQRQHCSGSGRRSPAALFCSCNHTELWSMSY